MNPEKIDIEKYAKEYISDRSKDFSFELVLDHIRKKQVLKSLSKYKHEHILEIGPGLEPLFLYIDDYNYKSYTIVEPSDKFVRHINKLAEGNDKITIIHGYIEDIYEKLNSFDFVIVSSVLHEVPDPGKFLQSIYRVCDVETVVHINVPNVHSFHRLLAYEMGYIKSVFEKSETDKKFQRHTLFDKHKLFNLLEKNGFQILSYGTYFIKPFTNEQMEKIIAQNIVSKDIIIGLEKMIKYLPDLGCEIFVEVKIKPLPLKSRSLGGNIDSAR